ncbi:LysE family translocator [uncultured Hoeflea sp.]|uniref:LysE family translocator n=1 Tax=uncultured Hoeflea sp. TaxID=538666 RepID=UPI0030DA901D
MMLPETIVGLFSLAFVAMITPGPNNLVALTVSVGGDPGKISKACSGIIAGTVCLIVLCWFGAASIFEILPGLQLVIVGLGCAYLLWGGAYLFLSAWRRSSGPGQSLPSSFWGLVCFQFVNPKAWVLCVAAVSAIQGRRSDLHGLIVLAAIFAIASTSTLAIWIGAGRLLPRRRSGEDTSPWVSALLGLALIGTSASLAISAF